MRNTKVLTTFTILVAVCVLASLTSPTPAIAQTETVLHDFNENGVDGFWPESPLIFDASGNIYGTTFTGGLYGTMAGTVFELTPATGGGWNEEILHDFNPNSGDGYDAFAGVTFDAHGNLFGTTYWGGAYGLGTVYELVPGAEGWSETVIHSFGNGTDGTHPNCTPIFESGEQLYCTTVIGGTHNHGTVFELERGAGGVWTESILFNFDGPDGTSLGFLTFHDGKLYGTGLGGSTRRGVVYEMSRNSSGVWSERVIHDFLGNLSDGGEPGALVFDAAGNIFGTTSKGGPTELGTLYELTPTGSGWTESIIHAFNNTTGDCFLPDGNLLIDSSGNLYGTCEWGGNFGYGAIFEFSPVIGGGWTETILYGFGNGTDGQTPAGGLTFDGLGNIYGTTFAGGPYVCEGINGCGTVFEFVP